MPTIPLCPINLDCPLRKSSSGKRIFCENYRYCEELGWAWSIPYRYENNCLIVDFSRTYRYKMSNGEVETIYFSSHEEDWRSVELEKRIRDNYRKAGWEMAVRNKNFPKNEEEEDMTIPF